MNQHNKKRIYISRSMFTDVTIINQLVGLLNQNGQETYCFVEGTAYNDKLVRTADLVIVYSHRLIGYVGKGQFSEIQLAKSLGIPVFFIDQPDLTGVLFNIGNPTLLDVNSWKSEYGKFETTSINTSLDMYLQCLLLPSIQQDDELLITITIK